MVSTISFSVFARLRGKRDELVEQFIASTRQNMVAAIPFLCVISLEADDILLVLLGPTWVEAATAARILCAVGLLRSLSFVMPPVLDGMGFPSRALLYNIVASTVLPAIFVAFAALFGSSLGYLSVALAWAAGYPVAFVVLLSMVLVRLELPAWAFLRRVVGIQLCAGGAVVAGLAARLALPGVPAAVRLVVVIAVTLGSLGVLLAYLQGISPRAVARALRGGGKEPT